MKPPDAPFSLGKWLVQPQLNRLSRSDGGDVQLEPKMMDVLVCLARGSASSPFLDGFLPPLYLGRLRGETSCALIRQHHLADGQRPDLTDDDVDAICHWGGGHPFVLQLLSKRVIEHRDVDRAVAAVAGDRSITSLFEVNLELLDEEQRSMLRTVAQAGEAGGDFEESPALHELKQLGLVETDDTAKLRITLPLLCDWLAER